jgi:hypothetical protein
MIGVLAALAAAATRLRPSISAMAIRLSLDSGLNSNRLSRARTRTR